ATRRIGFAREGRSLLLTDAITPKPRSNPHPVIDEYLRLADHLGCDGFSHAMELAVLPGDARRLDEFWRSQPAILRAKPYVAFNPGGAFGAAKHWPIQH